MTRACLTSALLAAFAAFTPTLRADLIVGFTTLDAAGTIPATASWGIADAGTPYGPSAALEIAVPFVMTAGGALDSVELPFARKSLTANSTTLRTFSLAADAGGKPGAVLESWCMVPGLTMSLVRLISTARPTLAAGTKYWLTAHINPTGTAADAWVSNGLGLNGQMFYRRSVTVAYTSFTGAIPAFRVKVGDSGITPANQAPVAQISAAPTMGAAPLAVAFSGAGSYDPDGSIVAYQWSFGDGTTSTEARPTHTFSAAGVYTVALTVRDNCVPAAQDSVQTTITVDASADGLTIGFTTLDAAGTIPATASWGIADPGTPYGPSAALEIAVPFVTAADGALDSVELPFARKSLTANSTTPRTFSLAVDAGGKPGAVLESWCMVPGLTMTLVRLSSTVRPALAAGVKYWFTAHINPTGTAADAWVSNGLGLNGQMLYRRSVTVAYTSFTGAIPAFRVKVGDSGITPVNQAPVAQISAAPTTGTAPLAVAFSGADSYDPDGAIVGYQWSFGDGATSTEARPTHTFSAAGVYTVALTVRDNCVPAAQDSVQTTITVDASVDGLTIGFTTLDTAGTIPATASWGIADPGTPYGPSAALELAVPFIMTAGGALDSVELPLARKSLTASSTTPRTFSLAYDAGGEPGALIESWSMVPGLTMSLVRLSSTARPALAAGVKYWFTAHINPTGTAADAWVSNDLGLDGQMLYRRAVTDSYASFTGAIPAFRVKVSDSGVTPVNQAPVAQISATPTTGTAPLAVAFSGAGSYDPDGSIVAYQWSFGDGTTSTEARPTHTFSAAGVYTVKLTVTDNGVPAAQNTVGMTITVKLPVNQPPVAQISAAPTTGTAPLAVAFSGAGSSDPDGSIVAYQWSFGDGTTSAEVRPTHTFSAAGVYTVRLTVTDNGIPAAQNSVQTTITVNAPVVVGVTVAYTTLDAAGSIPSASSWGIADPGTPYGPSAALEIAVPFVTAAGGALDSVELPFARKSLTANSTTLRTFSLAADAGGKPGAVLESWCMVPGLTMSLVRLSSTVRPTLAAGTKYWLTAHINPTGTAADAWVSNGLGLNGQMLYRRSVTVAYASFTGAIPAFRVKVEDSGVTPANQAPVAQISATPTTGTAPLAVAFSGAGSYDPDGSIVGYQWSFGDGTTSTEARPTHTFSAAGVYTVKLTVTDNCVPAAQDSVQTTITVDASVDVLTIGFTTLDTAGTIPAASSWGIADPGTPYGPSAALEIAVPFVTAAGGALDSVELPFARKSLTANSTTPRTFSLAVDAGGKPGAVLESWSMVPGLTMTLVRLSSTARPTLAAGVKYWFTAHINPTGTAADAWVSNGLGLNGQMLYRRSVTVAYASFTGALPAFRLNVMTSRAALTGLETQVEGPSYSPPIYFQRDFPLIESPEDRSAF